MRARFFNNYQMGHNLENQETVVHEHRYDLLHIPIEFLEDICNSFCVLVCTRFLTIIKGA